MQSMVPYNWVVIKKYGCLGAGHCMFRSATSSCMPRTRAGRRASRACCSTRARSEAHCARSVRSAVVFSYSVTCSASVCWLTSCAASATTAATSPTICEKGQHLVGNVKIARGIYKTRLLCSCPCVCSSQRSLSMNRSMARHNSKCHRSKHPHRSSQAAAHQACRSSTSPQSLILERPWPQPPRTLMRCLGSGGLRALAAWTAPPPPWQPPRARVSPCGASWPAAPDIIACIKSGAGAKCEQMCTCCPDS